MAFDLCEHKIRQVAIKAAIEIRKAGGLPEEKNITVLFNEVAPLLGIPVVQITSRDAVKLPAPHEMMDKTTGKPIIPHKDCPQCGKKEGLTLHPICASCTDSEGGKYATMWFCGEMDQMRNLIPGTGCGFKDKSKKHFITWTEELGVDFRSGTKADLGIRTVTDQGLK